MNVRDMPEGFGEGAWVGNTTLHPLGISLLIVCLIYMFAARRQNAFMPFFVLTCFVSPAQRIVIAGADFNFFRLYLFALCLRLFIRNENSFFKLNKFDVIYIAYATIYSLIYMYSSSSLGDPLGTYLDLLMLYFAIRCLVRRTEDVERLFKLLALLSIPVCILFIIESSSGRNHFSIFGGVPEFTKLREGRLRCQGPFPHPIIAGCFWAVLFPIFIALYMRSKNLIYMLACVACIAIVVTSSSSTPLLALVSAPIFLFLFGIRQHVKKLFFLGLVGALILHLSMNAPVWHLLSRVGAVGGSTSHFRFMLIDSFISHSNEWFLLGTNYTGHWFFGAQDLTNHFILVGVRSGILGLALFIVLIWCFYKNIYGATRVAHVSQKFFIWSIGASLSVACVSFLGVSYFGQPVYLFHMLFPISINLLMYEHYVAREMSQQAAK